MDELEWHSMNMRWSRAAMMKASRSWVMHRSSDVVGQVVEVFGPGEYISPENNKPVEEVVIKLNNGHALLFVNGAFDELTAHEVRAFELMIQSMAHWTKEIALFAKSIGVTEINAVRLISAVLRAQLDALREVPNGG